MNTLEDLVLPFQIDRFDLRGRVVRMGPSFSSMLAGHDYPPAVAALLGEAVALSGVLAHSLKYDGNFTLQIQGSGPISLMVVDMQSDGATRGYARFDPEAVKKAEWLKGPQVERFLGKGHLAFTVDPRKGTDRYQGITDLSGETLGECAQCYFENSEQIDTMIKLAADKQSAAAIMIQRLPAESKGPIDDLDTEEDELWDQASILLGTMTDEEMLNPRLAPADLLYRLYHQEDVKIYPTKALRYECRCSREKVGETLKSFPRDEVRDLKQEDGEVSVVCQFCNTDYRFNDDDIEKLFGG